MSRQLVRGRTHVVIAILVLALGLGSVALAQHSSSFVQVNVTLLDGKLKISQTTFAAGSLNLLVVNQGKLSHALAIMGTGLQPRRTPTLTTGKSAHLMVILRAGGSYHVWDPVRSSMSHATMLTVKKATATTGSSGVTSSSGGTSGGGGGAPSAGPGVNPPDPCEGMGM